MSAAFLVSIIDILMSPWDHLGNRMKFEWSGVPMTHDSKDFPDSYEGTQAGSL